MVIAEVIVERVRSTKIGTTSFPVVLGEISIVTSPDELGGKIRLGRPRGITIRSKPPSVTRSRIKAWGRG